MSYIHGAAARLWSVAMDHDAAHKYIYMLASVLADLLRLVIPGWADQPDRRQHGFGGGHFRNTRPWTSAPSASWSSRSPTVPSPASGPAS